MESRWCTACGAVFTPRPQSPHQTYCSKDSCQKQRRRLWQQAKRSSDPDYLENQAQAQREWGKRNTHYWREYRERHPAYVAKNRSSQKARNQDRKLQIIAKKDAWTSAPLLTTGTYFLRVVAHREIANDDVWIVELTVPKSK